MKKVIYSLIVLTLSFNSFGYKNIETPHGNDSGSVQNGGDDRAAGCELPNDFMYLNYNNVKALIMSGGMMWQDRATGNPSYIVANPQNAHVIYAGALWMGGVDVNGQLKLAGQRYGQGRDFFTGPLSAFGGSPGNYDPSVVQTADLNVIRAHGDAEIIPSECTKYDRFFTIRKREVIDFDRWWQCTYGPNPDPVVCADIDDIDPEVLQRILEWPAHGDVALGQDKFLAPFYDRDGDNFYDPIGDGDYPWYDLNGEVDCRNDRRVTLFGDETNWWVFNDKGNIHTETGGDPIGMEVRAQAFAFATNDAINDMTFYNYEMINRSTQTIYNTYFAQYVDADIGNYANDYVGCDVSRGLGYAYNGEAVDQASGGTISFGQSPPAIGVDFFEGPYQDLDQIDNPLTTDIQLAISQKGIPYEGLGLGYGDGLVDNERLGMRRFIYYNSSGGVQGDPSTAAEYYGLMDGFWKTSGIDITYGGTGLGGSIIANYMFPGDSDPLYWGTAGTSTSPWSEELEGNQPADRRFVEIAGPFTLMPGAVNNLTVGVVYGRDLGGDNLASVDVMLANDSRAQALFDACFEIVEPPLAPALSIQELENELILYISDKGGLIETYQQEDILNIPKYDDQGNLNDRFYRFQGYQIYQMKDATASVSDIGDETKAILVAQCDIEDDVTKLVNYTYDEQNQIPIATVKVSNAENKGIRHSFRITGDQFAQGNKTLVNHKKYYFIAVAYAFNEFKKYDPFLNGALDGQKLPYLASRQSLTGGKIESVEGIPHNPAPEAGGTSYGTYYGYQPEITQIDGLGNGGYFVKLTKQTEEAILSNNSVNEMTYAQGAGPINVKVIDPLNLKNGDYTVSFPDDAAEYKFALADSIKWTISRTFEGVTETKTALYGIGTRNEVLIPEWGISVDIKQIFYQGKFNGAGQEVLNTEDDTYIEPIGATIEYEDSSKQWLSQVSDNDISYSSNWIMAGLNDVSSTDGCSAFLWVFNPCYYRDRNGYAGDEKYESLLNGGIAPFNLVNNYVYGSPFGAPGLTYTVNGSSGPLAASIGSALLRSNFHDLHDVDIVITSDKTKWTKCVVFEINDNETQTEGGADKMELRAHASVDVNGDPISGTGMGYFPGYAIDVTTGDRLNMAFSENSWLQGDNGNDMIWNPTSTYNDQSGIPIFGGMHYVYVFGVSDEMPAYDEGQTAYTKLSDPTTYIGPNFTKFFQDIMWVWEPMLNEGSTLLETDARISVRVNKPYQVRDISPKSNNGRPKYRFTIDDDIRVITDDVDVAKSALDMINIVPNPYYAYSSYESSRLDTRVKITNLPDQCEVTIFNMQGALVRQYSKDDPLTSLDWDLKNYRGIPIAGGVYIIHVNVPGVGEKIIKWYGVLREADLQGF
ncbi:MAG TPA: T9SS type A sorting domain-containing protein [Crocinitomix sp.]|nr:T9SS type A sorting domain-containing protein [Crocinitomix sp.]